MKKAFASIAAAAILVALTVAPTAGAATEFGDSCTGDSVAPGPYTLVTLSSPAAGLPLSAPVSGVITKVKVNRTVPIPVAVPQQVKVLRPAGGDSFTVVNQTTVQAGFGQTVADARMSVQAGDKLANHGPAFVYEGKPAEGFTFYCEEVPGALGGVPGDVGVGSTTNFPQVTESRVPLAAVIEPDADQDGYGDETQDACPFSAVTQGPCPPIVLDASTLTGRKAVTVYIATDTEGSVSVKGVVKLGKGKKATLKAGPKAVYPGKIASFKLKFNGNLTKRLQELEPSKKLTLKVTASATNIASVVSTDQAKVKLKGQG